MARGFLLWCWVVLAGCSVLRSSGDFEFGQCRVDADCDVDNARGVCLEATCSFGCEEGFADCDGDPANGCERSLRTVTDCQACDLACEPGKLCDETMGCVPDCGAETACDGECVDTDTDPENCGLCGNECDDEAGGAAACRGGFCALDCEGTLGDCDGMLGTGCETDLSEDVQSCGACGNECSTNNATAECVASECRFTCDAGFGDCNDDPDDACETELRDDPANCGGCGVTCDDGVSCIGGLCDPVVDGALGLVNTCFVRQSGRLNCFGNNAAGQLGNGFTYTTNPEPTPVVRAVGTELRVRDVAVGDSHVCALDLEGKAWCWGANDVGQLGVPNTGDDAVAIAPSPVAVESDVAAWEDVELVSIVSRYRHTCALSAEGDVWCWGVNYGGCVNGSGNVLAGPVPRAVRVPVGGAVAAIATGATQTCVLLEDEDHDGEVHCFGVSLAGELGRMEEYVFGFLPPALAPGPVQHEDGAPLTGVRSIAADVTASCAATDDEVYCWGDSEPERFAGADGNNFATPVVDLGAETIGGPVDELAIGGLHGCARVGAAISCWGNGFGGQLGDGRSLEVGEAARPTPLPVTLPDGVTPDALLSGAAGSCLLASGEVWCWGTDASDQLAIANRIVRLEAAPVVSPLGTPREISQLHSGELHTCGVIDEQAYCWGTATFDGRLGSLAQLHAPTPTLVAEVTGTVGAVGVGRAHSCATVGLDLYCWGENAAAQCGIPPEGGFLDTSNPVAPTLTGVAENVREVAVGVGHTCVRVAGGVVVCFGSNELRQCGRSTGGTVDAAAAPRLDFGGVAALQVAAGAAHTCVRLANGEVRCWGDNSRRQLGPLVGEGTATDHRPREIVAARTAIHLEAGRGHTCAIVPESVGDEVGRVLCWGAGSERQLGRPGAFREDSPMPASAVDEEGTPITDAVDLALGVEHTCVLRSDGEVLCWGENRRGGRRRRHRSALDGGGRDRGGRRGAGGGHRQRTRRAAGVRAAE